MIHYKYTADSIDTILNKQKVIKSLLSRFTTNHPDYNYLLIVDKEDNKYILEAKLTRP